MKPLHVFGGILATLALVAFMISQWFIGTYNAFQTRDEQVSAAWSQVLSVYKKRADLVPNLVSTVQGYAGHENTTLNEVTKARAAATAITIDPSKSTPEQLQAYANAQQGLSAALGKLLAIKESYPDLKANQGFLKLQDELGAIEGQATAARNRYIREVAAFNVNVRSFWSGMVAAKYNIAVKPQLKFDDENAIKTAPVVKFGGK